jgi:hypothetical protein
MVSALVLGISSMTPVLAYGSSMSGVQLPNSRWMTIGASIFTLLLIQLMILFTRSLENKLQYTRVVLLCTGLILSAFGLFQSYWHTIWFGCMIFFIVVSEECAGRWLFYGSRLLDGKKEARL